jgi:MscS family membrane protein
MTAAPQFVPEVLLRPGPYRLLLWQWIALPVCAVLALLTARLLGGISHAVLRRIARRTTSRFDDELSDNLGGPIALGWFVAVSASALGLLELADAPEAFARRLLHGLFFVAFFWALFRAVDVARVAMRGSAWAGQNPASRSLLALGARVAKVLIGAMAVIAVVSALGYPVASLIAGLGIGGLALALAAQKTVENLFGAFSIGVDQPLREGDYVRLEGAEGTVEMIGLRSTRIRTPDRTVVSIPNGKLADQRTENLSARDRMRLSCTLGLEYGTTAAQMRAVLAGIERALRAHPLIWEDNVSVRFVALSESSLDVEVNAWFRTTDAAEFALVRQEMLLQFLQVVETAGTGFAFPTRTIHVAAASASAAASQAKSA